MLANPGFGVHFTDHMVTARWNRTDGWHGATVEPYRPIELDPAAMVLHYGQAIFEGLKAYRHADGSVQSFRPESNAERFRRSARRLAMPELPDELFLGSLRELVAVDGRWVPEQDEESLYLRPFMISTEVGLGVRPAAEYLYLLIASPAGSYFASRDQAGERLVVDRVRACRARRHRRGQVRRQLRGVAGRAGTGRRAGLRPGGVAGRRSSAGGSRRWAG